MLPCVSGVLASDELDSLVTPRACTGKAVFGWVDGQSPHGFLMMSQCHHGFAGSQIPEPTVMSLCVNATDATYLMVLSMLPEMI